MQIMNIQNIYDFRILYENSGYLNKPACPFHCRICGDDVPSGPIFSLSNTMVVTFISDFIINAGGFSAAYYAVSVETNDDSPLVSTSCYNTFAASDDAIKSPRFPRPYPRRRLCFYTITAPQGFHVELDFEEEFGIEFHNRCIWDYLEVHLGDGISSDLRYLLKF